MAKSNTNASTSTSTPSAAEWAPKVPMNYVLTVGNRARNPLSDAERIALSANLASAVASKVQFEDFVAAIYRDASGAPLVIKHKKDKHIAPITRHLKTSWEKMEQDAAEQGIQDFPPMPRLSSKFGAATGGGTQVTSTEALNELKSALKALASAK